MDQEIKLGIYQHYNGKVFEVIGVCRHSETLEEMIVYRHLEDDHGLWVRPKDMFFEQVEIDGNTKPRFSFISSLFTKPPVLR